MRSISIPILAGYFLLSLASPILASSNIEFAQNELKFIQAINQAYPPETSVYIEPPGDVGQYRTLCSQIILYAIESHTQNTPINPQHPAITTLLQNASQVYPTFFNDTSHIAPTAYINCLLALNLVQDSLPQETIRPILVDTAEFLHSRYTWDGTSTDRYYYTVPFHQQYQSWNAGNTQAEEVGIEFMAYALGAKLIPPDIVQAVTGNPNGNQAWLNRARELLDYSYTRCDTRCPFSNLNLEPWLVANHQMNPATHYTHSILSLWGELAALYHQLDPQGQFPQNFYTDTQTATSLGTPAQFKTALINVATAMDKYTTKAPDGTPTFGYTGPFQIVDGARNPQITLNYAHLRYTPQTDLQPLINSSAPQNQVDSLNFYRILGTDVIKAYIIDQDQVWYFHCQSSDQAVDSFPCVADYTKPIAEYFNFPQTSESGWSNYPVPQDQIDSQDSIQYPSDNSLHNYIFSGDRVWHYQCQIPAGQIAGADCQAVNTQTLTQFLAAITNQENWQTPPPTDSLDSHNSFFLPDNHTLKAYFTKNDHLWHYTCQLNPTSHSLENCTALYDKPLADFWTNITLKETHWVWTDAQGNSQTQPPNDHLDSLTQYFNADYSSLETFVITNDRIWHYRCLFDQGNNTGCQAVETLTLAQYYDQHVNHQSRWPYPLNSPGQYPNVDDWGYDQTGMSSGFSAMHVIAPEILSIRYQQLQQEQIKRGHDLHPYFPTHVANGQWTFDPYPQLNLKSRGHYLTDGWLSTYHYDTFSFPNHTHMLPLNQRIGAQHWHNIYIGYNHAMAYLAVSPDTLIRPFFSPRSNPFDYDTDDDVDYLDFLSHINTHHDLFSFNLFLTESF